MTPTVTVVTALTATISAVTNTSLADVEITTNASHGLSSDMRVRIASSTGVTQINGYWFITVTSATKFKISATLGGSLLQGDGASWISGGAVTELRRLSTDSTQRCVGIEVQMAGTGGGYFGTAALAGSTAGVICSLNSANGYHNLTPYVQAPSYKPYLFFVEPITGSEKINVTIWKN